MCMTNAGDEWIGLGWAHDKYNNNGRYPTNRMHFMGDDEERHANPTPWPDFVSISAITLAPSLTSFPCLFL